MENNAKLNEWRKRAATRSPKAKELIENLLSDLESPEWVVAALAEFICRPVGEAHDAAQLILTCLEMQLDEIDGSAELDDTPDEMKGG